MATMPWYTVIRLLQRALTFGDTLVESEQYKELAVASVMQRGTWLVSASDHFYGDLRDSDWEHIFSNLEKDPDSFARYYPLFCIELGNWSVRNAVTALVVNDDLYAYVRSLPPMEEG